MNRLHLRSFHLDVTPPVGHPLCGGWYPAAASISTPLAGKGMILQWEEELPVVIAVLDWAELSNGEHQLWRERLAGAAGTSPSRVTVHTTHAHDTPWPDRSAQAILHRFGHGNLIMDPEWADGVLGQAVEAVREAMNGPGEGVTSIRVGRARIEGLASNRRIIGADGKSVGVRYTRCRDTAVREAPEGLIDPYLRTISFWNGTRKLLAAHSYAIHPTSYDRTASVTPDFVGLARNRLEEEEGVPHLYFTGCAGNITAGRYNDGEEDNREKFTQKILAAMRRAEAGSKPLKTVRPRWRTEPVLLPPDPSKPSCQLEETLRQKGLNEALHTRAAFALAYRQRCEAGIPIELHALDFGGEATLLYLPAEAFIEYQLEAQALRPEGWMSVAAYGDCGPGYIPLCRSYGEGGYEPSDAFCSPQSEAVLRAAIIRLLA